MIATDNRGTHIEIGHEVAYNLSGGIAHGRVKSITPKPPCKSWQAHHFLIEIELLNDTAGQKAGWVSKVKSDKNLLVFFEPEGRGAAWA